MRTTDDGPGLDKIPTRKEQSSLTMATRIHPKGAAVIGQSGGPTCVINQSLVGATLELRKSKQVTAVYGARHGVAGMLEQDLIDLGKEDVKTLCAVAETPSSALGSVRKKPSPGECRRIFENFFRMAGITK